MVTNVTLIFNNIILMGLLAIIDYLPKSSDPSTIIKIWDEIDKLKKANFWERTLPLILSFFAFVITIGLAIFLFVLENNS